MRLRREFTQLISNLPQPQLCLSTTLACANAPRGRANRISKCLLLAAFLPMCAAGQHRPSGPLWLRAATHSSAALFPSVWCGPAVSATPSMPSAPALKGRAKHRGPSVCAYVCGPPLCCWTATPHKQLQCATVHVFIKSEGTQAGTGCSAAWCHTHAHLTCSAVSKQGNVTTAYTQAHLFV